jgi:pSer/pThr/pTyr-binding forkhead associated (FHA) protein
MSLVSQQDHLLILEDDKGRRGFVLKEPRYTVGRDPKCDLRLISQFVSRFHAILYRIEQEDGSITYNIVDGDLDGKPSSNGLLINGRKRSQHDLQHEDKIVFGPQVRATYYLLEAGIIMTEPPDEFDITLIFPMDEKPSLSIVPPRPVDGEDPL